MEMFRHSREIGVFVATLVLLLTNQLAAQHPAPVIDHQVMTDVEIPSGHTGDPIAFFDDLSWRTFIALNWPAVAGKRGVPDGAKTFGAVADNVVWETWKADFELFQPNGQRPAEWDSFATASPCADLSLESAGNEKLLGTAGTIETAISHFNQARFGDATGTLIAQNQTYTRFELRMNRTQFDFIRGDSKDPTTFRYLAANLPGEDDEPLVFPFGSIEIKAAWREFKLPEEKALLSRYYTRTGMLVDPPNNKCRQATVGLVGLHIVHRTPSRPEWVWSTFEHVENLEAPTGIHPTYRDPADMTTRINVLEAIVDETHPPKLSPTRTQVKRMKAIHVSTNQTNQLYRNHAQIQRTVWANYQLVMTQWPTNPAKNEMEFKERSLKTYPLGAGTPFPGDNPTSGTAISNVTMETPTPFQQQFSCMRCHFSRRNHNTEFVWFLRTRAFDPSPERVKEKRARILEFSTEMLKEAAK